MEKRKEGQESREKPCSSVGALAQDRMRSFASSQGANERSPKQREKTADGPYRNGENS